METVHLLTNRNLLVNFCKTTAFWKSGDFEDVLSQACNFFEVKAVRTKKESFFKAFGKPQIVETPAGTLYIWNTWDLRILLMDHEDHRLVFIEILIGKNKVH